MADTMEQTQPPSEQSTLAAESGDISAAEPTKTDATEPTDPIDSIDSFTDVALPPIDKTLPTEDTSLPSIDTTLPLIDPTIPSLPPIDTTLPPLDTTLPATDGLHGIDTNFSFSDAKFDEAMGDDPGATTDSGHNPLEQLQSSSTPISQPPALSNGIHSQPPSQQHSPHHQQQQPPQQQYSPHQQLHQQSQQSPDMYHNHQGISSQMNSSSMQGQSSHIPQAPIGSPMPSNMPPMASVSQYMAGYPTNVSQMGMSPGAQMRYQLPGDPNKMLSGGRHKKEVKRRTKTGCLTCRKRRIKCDEGHPVCRNCVKSKRDCLGYDPVFKQPTPSAIQPAPNPQPSLVVNPQDPSSSQSSYPSAPPGYVPAASQPFAPSQPPPTPTDRHDYGAAIDPSLDRNNSSTMTSVQSVTDGGLQPTVNPATTTTGNSEPTSFRLKQVQISDLLALRGIPPPPPHPITTLPPNRLEEIQAVFLATYAPAIDRFFETRWFQERALNHLLANAQLMAEYSALIEAFNDRNLSDPNVVTRLESFEASVVWSTMTLCRHVMNGSNGNHGQDYDLLAASKRLDVIESMITGEHLDSNPLAQFPAREPAANPPSLPDQLMQRQLDFWSAIGYFLTLHDNEASSAKEIDDTLARCRTLLDTYENRDVIYSIAIARHLGQRWADFPRSFPQPITTNEKDAGAKLYVAQKFLEQEAGGKGTTQVIKRICGMVVRSWFVSRE
ncbi:C6 finger domain protein [Aspergillus rambellii]|uniref:C6 finger domain protein n=1 Tax=Aspergillus rambellii TaxID=308745 RepID=A0A0F8XNK6_9EURO|nr:C6 finger domain protein [Aspergillus rambellii]